MKCPRCQHDNREGRRFCAECGASLALACPACGFSNEPGEKFCGGCGAPLGAATGVATGSRFSSPESYTPKHPAERILTSKAALEGERKQVTVLFADLKSSMELLADRDPEEARKLLDPVLERMMEAVHRYEGIGLLLVVIFTLTGCLGPATLHQAVLGYNESVGRLERDLLLLNIARTHQRLPGHFTATSSVTATFDYRTSLGASATLFEQGEPIYGMWSAHGPPGRGPRARELGRRPLTMRGIGCDRAPADPGQSTRA